MCKVSIITSVYNCEKYISETINSVLAQTYTDWEFILINDCSKDESSKIIKSFADPRIVFVDNDTNKGQCENLNHAISISRGEYIARLDHDDLCYPERLERQVRYLDNNPEVVLLGCKMDLLIDDKICSNPEVTFSGKEEVAITHSFFNYCLPHSSFMIRKKTLIEKGIRYNKKYVYAEDYDLLLQMLCVGKIDCLDEVLITYRIFPEQCSQIYGEELKSTEIKEIKCNYINNLPLKYKKYIEKAYLGELHTLKEYKLFQKAFKELEIYHGMDTSETKSLYKNECLRRTIRDIYYYQKRSLNNMVCYLMNPYRDIKWLINAITAIIGRKWKTN